MASIRRAAGVRRALPALLLASVASGSAADATGTDQGVTATFEGRSIRLDRGWGEAEACWSDERATRCYRSEAEMDRAELNATGPGLLADCSTTLRLYSSASFGGSVLALRERQRIVSLADLGFNNVTSSYRVGACAAEFFDTTSGGTAYPGNTNAGVSSTSMSSGWDNRVGSVFIS